MEEDIMIQNGVEYVGYRALSYGDYDNSADVERANVRHLQEKFPEMDSIGFTNIEVNNYTGTKEIVDIENQLGDIFKIRGEMGGQSLYIKKDSDLDMEIGQSLHNYPVLDDDMHAKVQAELKEEAFDDYGEREIRKLIEYKYESINHMKLDKDLDFDIDDNFSDEEIKNIWEKTLEKNANDRGDIFENGSFYIDTDIATPLIIESANEVVEERQTKKKEKSQSLEP